MMETFSELHLCLFAEDLNAFGFLLLDSLVHPRLFYLQDFLRTEAHGILFLMNFLRLLPYAFELENEADDLM